ALVNLRGELFQVTAGCGAGGGPAVERADVRPGAELELRVEDAALPDGVLSGRLVDSEGTAIADAGVELWRPRKSSWAQPFATTRSAADGRFELPGLAAGTFELLASRGATRARRVTDGTLGQHERRDLGAVVLEPSVTLRLEVTRADGAP